MIHVSFKIYVHVGLCSGSTLRILLSTCAAPSETVSGMIKVPFNILAYKFLSLGAKKGSWPTSITYKTIPAAHTSAGGPK